jgi:uncharacterized protein YaeQ
VALQATVFTFDIELADVDRGVYETLALRVPCHPSETEEFLLTRVLAYCLEHAEGIAFSKGGLSAPDEPAISVRDLTGALVAWIDVGAPAAERLHRAGKAAGRVAVYTHGDPSRLVRAWSGARIHRGDEIALHAVDRTMLAELVARLQRRMAFSLMVTGGRLYVSTADGAVFEGTVLRHALATS